MSDRIKPREYTQEPDTPVVSSFAGLSSASLNQTGDIIFQDKLVNAVVTKSGEIRKRYGSGVNAVLTWFNDAQGYEVYGFQFDGINYRLVRTGTQLSCYAVNNDGAYHYVAFKDSVFRQESLNEKATYATVIEGNTCHILIATPSTQLVSFTILSRDATITSKPNATQIQYNITDYPSTTNTMNNGNTIVWSPAKQIGLPIAVSQANGVMIFTGSTPLTWAAVGVTVKQHSFFWLRYSDANYYPGIYLYNTALRRNAVALDVNVNVPQELYENPIFNEPQIQDIYKQTLVLFKNNPTTVASDFYAYSNNHQPATADQWDFSDGGYKVDPKIYTRPSPAFVAFGGLEAESQNSRVIMCRLRKVLIGNGENVQRQHITQFVNKEFPQYPTYYTANVGAYATNPTNIASFFGMTSYDPGSSIHKYPGVDLAAVVELIYNRTVAAGSAANQAVADLEANSSGAITINDGYIVPLYGYNAIAKTQEHKYPPIVAAVGNRIILTGSSNLIAVSHADWTYRGFSFNNFQASTISFDSSSAYYVRLTQGSSVVKAITTVNGVLIAATDVGVFRVSGSNASSPPNATDGNVARISNEILPTNRCFSVYENKVFYASRNGLYQLQYLQEVNEIANESMSSHVSSYFTKFTTNTLTYSDTLRAFLISFTGTRELLVLALDSETWSTIKMSTTLAPDINQTYDGFTLKTTNTATDDCIILCDWTTASTDLSNFAAFVGLTTAIVPGASQTINNYATSLDDLVTPAELIATLSAKCVQTEGDNTAMVLGAATVNVVEAAGGISALPIISYFVTKAFVSDRLNRGHRIRGCNILMRGQGALTTALVLPTSFYGDRYQSFNTYLVNASSIHQGEGMLNAAYDVQLAKGNTINLRVPMVGISEAWQLACMFSSGLYVAGLQFDTSRKSLRRTR